MTGVPHRPTGHPVHIMGPAEFAVILRNSAEDPSSKQRVGPDNSLKDPKRIQGPDTNPKHKANYCQTEVRQLACQDSAAYSTGRLNRHESQSIPKSPLPIENKRQRPNEFNPQLECCLWYVSCPQCGSTFGTAVIQALLSEIAMGTCRSSDSSAVAIHQDSTVHGRRLKMEHLAQHFVFHSSACHSNITMSLAKHCYNLTGVIPADFLVEALH